MPLSQLYHHWHNCDGSEQINEGIFVSTYIHILYIHIYMVCVYLYVYTSCIHTRCKYISMVFSQFGLVNICQHKVKLIQVHLTRQVLLYAAAQRLSVWSAVRGELVSSSTALAVEWKLQMTLEENRVTDNVRWDGGDGGDGAPATALWFPSAKKWEGRKGDMQTGRKKKQYANTAGPEPMQTNIL